MCVSIEPLVSSRKATRGSSMARVRRARSSSSPDVRSAPAIAGPHVRLAAAGRGHQAAAASRRQPVRQSREQPLHHDQVARGPRGIEGLAPQDRPRGCSRAGRLGRGAAHATGLRVPVEQAAGRGTGASRGGPCALCARSPWSRRARTPSKQAVERLVVGAADLERDPQRGVRPGPGRPCPRSPARPRASSSSRSVTPTPLDRSARPKRARRVATSVRRPRAPVR